MAHPVAALGSLLLLERRLFLLRAAVAGRAAAGDAALQGGSRIPVALLHILLDVLEQAVAGGLVELLEELAGVLHDLLCDLLLAGVLHALADLLPLRHHLTDGQGCLGGRGALCGLLLPGVLFGRCLLGVGGLVLHLELRLGNRCRLCRRLGFGDCCLLLLLCVELGQALCHGPLQGSVRVDLLPVLDGGNVLLLGDGLGFLRARRALNLLNQLLGLLGKPTAGVIRQVTAGGDGLLVPSRRMELNGQLIDPLGLRVLLAQTREHIDLLVGGDRGDLVHLVLQDQTLVAVRRQGVEILHQRKGRRQIALQAVSSIEKECQLTE